MAFTELRESLVSHIRFVAKLVEKIEGLEKDNIRLLKQLKENKEFYDAVLR